MNTNLATRESNISERLNGSKFRQCLYLHVHLCVSRTDAQNRHYSIFDKEGLLMREVGIYQRRGEVRENRLLEERL